MDHQRASPGALFGNLAGSSDVDGARQLRLAFSLVDRRVGGGIDDDIGREIANRLADGLQIGEVDLIDVDGQHLAHGCERALQVPAHLAVGSGHEQSHYLYLGS